MELLASMWDNLYFTPKGEINCGIVSCANWQTSILHHIGSTINFFSDLAIDTTLSLDPNMDLLGQFTAADVDVEPLHVRKTIYPPATFVGLFLEQDLMPMYEWNRLRCVIVDAGQEVDCRPTVD